jgi:hypothetical protein
MLGEEHNEREVGEASGLNARVGVGSWRVWVLVCTAFEDVGVGGGLIVELIFVCFANSQGQMTGQNGFAAEIVCAYSPRRDTREVYSFA